MGKIKIILVDDHTIVRDGLKVLLMNIPDIEIIGEASNGKEFFKLLSYSLPDIVILDLMMPGMSGIEVSHKLKEEFPEIKIIILTANTTNDSIFSSLKAGALGYLPKDVGRDELVEAIYHVYDGNEYLAHSITCTVLKRYFYHSGFNKPNYAEKQVKLTPREIEIIELFSEGLIYKEIATKLNISVRTVEAHKVNIMEKLEIKSIIEMVKYAIKNGIIEI